LWSSQTQSTFENLRLELRRGSLILAVLGALRVERYGYTLRKTLADAGMPVDEGTLRPDEVHMHRCLELAIRGRGAVSPNPMVGAVIVKDGVVIGEGWHGQFGGPHAEVNAIAAASSPVAVCTRQMRGRAAPDRARPA